MKRAAKGIDFGEYTMTTAKKATSEVDSIDAVWKKFFKEHSEELRNKLMEHYLPLVKYTAERIYVKLPDKVEVDDLISAGIFGFPIDRCAEIMLRTAIDYINGKTLLERVVFCLYGRDAYEVFEKQLIKETKK